MYLNLSVILRNILFSLHVNIPLNSYSNKYRLHPLKSNRVNNIYVLTCICYNNDLNYFYIVIVKKLSIFFLRFTSDGWSRSNNMRNILYISTQFINVPCKYFEIAKNTYQAKFISMLDLSILLAREKIELVPTEPIIFAWQLEETKKFVI